MQQGTRRKQSPWWHQLFWIPVGASVVIAALFLFGVLPPKAAPAQVPGVSLEEPASPPPAGAQPGKDIPAEPGGAATPTPLPEQTPLPEEARLGKPVGKRETAYRIAASLSEDFRRFSARMQVNYTNTTPDSLYELVFHLPANAYYRPTSIGAQNESGTYPGGYEQGGTIISSVMLDGAVAYFATSEDEQLLILPFVRELRPGESAEVFLEFVLDAPTRNARFGYTELGYQLGNCWPILAVYQDGEWVTDGYQFTGDPFYSEVADYTVSLTYPAHYTMACTGGIVSEETSGGFKTTTISGSGLREFACMLASGVVQATQAEGGVRLRALALSDASAERALQHAGEALRVFLPYLGSCPYDTLTIAQVEMANASGMEYPGLIFVQRELFLPGNERMLAFTIYHEVAHQWFYGLVGSDQVNAPWLDEAFAAWFGFLPMEQRDPEGAVALRETYLSGRAPLGGRVDGSIADYRNEVIYSDSVYWRGAIMLENLLQKLGADVYYSGISIYLQNNAGLVATGADVITAFEQASGQPLESWFAERLAAPAGAAEVATPTEEAA